MGQKVHPFGFRLGPLYTWKSRWFSKNADYQKYVLEDYQLRKYLGKRIELAGVSEIGIERSINSVKIVLHVSRPGVVIGRGGANLEQLKKDILHLLKVNPSDPKGTKIDLKVEEIKNPDLDAQIVLQRLKDQLQKRFPHRRAVSQAIEKIMGAGAKGVKVIFAGRINGAEIGRTEKYGKGTVPTQTLRADIDYAEGPAFTKSGFVGIKVYINRGERATE